MNQLARFACVLLLSLIGGWAQGATYQGMELRTPQPDGTTIPTRVYGDEFVGWMEHDGYTIVADPASRAFCYARLEGGRLVSSGQWAGRVAPATLGILPHLRPARHVIAAEAKQRRKERGVRTDEPGWGHYAPTPTAKAAGPLMAPPSKTTTGQVVGLTLAVDFSDVPGNSTMLGELDGMLNGDTYTGGGNTGSVKKYYSDVSAGAFTFTNQVNYKAYLRMPHTWAYYNFVDGDSAKGCRDDSARLLTADAIQVLNTYSASQARDALGLDLSLLTVDGSGNIMSTSVFFAGNNSGVWAQGLWPMSWAMSAPVPLTGGGAGKSVYRMQITNIGDSLTIGTFCHECGHMVCDFPDLYDTSYLSSGLGYFCLMSAGNHANDGKTPTRISAYLRYKAGWVTGSSLVDLGVAGFSGWGVKTATGAVVYAYGKASGSSSVAAMGPGVTEYFLVETRPKLLWDAYLPDEGLAIWHVDETSSNSKDDLAYKGHYECALMQADGLDQFGTQTGYYGDDQDLYPSTTPANNALKDDTNPTSRWWDGTASGLTITEILPVSGDSQLFRFGSAWPVFQQQPATVYGRPGEMVSFTVSVISQPDATLSWERSPNGVSWTAIPGATGTTYSFLMTDADASAWFHCIATNTAGSTTSTAAQLKLSPAPAVNNTVSQPAGAAVGRAVPASIGSLESGGKSCGVGSGLGLVCLGLALALAAGMRRARGKAGR